MKIVQINSVCDVGSTGKIMADLARKSNSNGDETICAYGRRAGDANDLKTIRIGTNIDIFWHIIVSRLFDMQGLGSRRATKKFLKEIDKFNPEMFHLHNLHGYYINYPLLFDYIKKKGIKVKWTLHDSWPFTGHCAEPVCYDCNKWKNENCSGCDKKMEYPKSFIDRGLRNFRMKKNSFTGVEDLEIITPSNWLASIVKESFLGEYKIVVIHNEIDKEIFKPTESDFRSKYGLENKVVYLCVSFVWLPEKLNQLIDLTLDFESDEMLVLVGINSKEKNKIKNDKIICIERTDSKEELAKIYTAADVFINPTVKADNYPTVNLEAQACGTPVVTYESGGTAETINEGMGIAVPYGNTKEMLRYARLFGKKEKLTVDR